MIPQTRERVPLSYRPILVLPNNAGISFYGDENSRAMYAIEAIRFLLSCIPFGSYYLCIKHGDDSHVPSLFQMPSTSTDLPVKNSINSAPWNLPVALV